MLALVCGGVAPSQAPCDGSDPQALAGPQCPLLSAKRAHAARRCPALAPCSQEYLLMFVVVLPDLGVSEARWWEGAEGSAGTLRVELVHPGAPKCDAN